MSVFIRIFLFLFLVSCRPSADEPIRPRREWPDPGLVDLSTDWMSATPAQEDIPDDVVDRALRKATDIEGLESVVIIKNGRLIAERYLEGDESTLRHIRSCTKGILSTLTGMSLKVMELQNLDQPVSDFLVPDIIQAIPKGFDQITIGHLLTMRSGLDWDENDFTQWTSSPDALAFVFDLSLEQTPGTAYRYNTPALQLLAASLEQATHMTLPDLVQQRLFQPLGINSYQWEKDAQGSAYGGFGLQLRTRDLAKIGYCLIQEGHTGTQMLLDSQYLHRSTTNLWNGTSQQGAFQELGYGYLWWTDHTFEDPAFFGWGYGGQLVYCVPNQYLVIAVTAKWNVDGETDARQFSAISNYLLHSLRNAVQ